MARFIEGEWLDDKELLDFLVERIFILQERIKELEPLSKTKPSKEGG